jgi:potassium-transporting ATPase KdpC subunit
MKKHLLTSFLMTVVTTILLGIVYPMVVTGIAQVLFPVKANGQIVYVGGQAIGSRIIGQPFSGDAYFHSRPSTAGNGYDAANSGASNLSPTSRKLVDQVTTRAAAEYSAPDQVPIDLVTASGSGLDPHISPAAAEYQVARIARARVISESAVRSVVRKRTESRQFGVLGEARVNVLELNLDLDRTAPLR